MDCLDTPDLELEILSRLAGNVARSTLEEQRDAGVITAGLPESISSSAEDGGPDEDDSFWDISSRNHVISYAHYVAALPEGDGRMKDCVPTIGRLVGDLWSVRGELGDARMSASQASGSGGFVTSHNDTETVTTVLLQAVCHVARVGDDEDVRFAQGLLAELCERVAGLLLDERKGVIAHGLTLLHTLHAFILCSPLPMHRFTPAGTHRLLAALRDLASRATLAHLDPERWERAVPRSGSAVSSLAADTMDANGAIRAMDREGPMSAGTGTGTGTRRGVDPDLTIIRRLSGMRLALLVLDMQGVLLSSMLVPPMGVEGAAQLDAEEGEFDAHKASRETWADLLEKRVGQTEDTPLQIRLGASADGRTTLEALSTQALAWWDEIMHGTQAGGDGQRGIGLGAGVVGRNESGLGGTADDGEYAVIVAIMKLETLASLHADQPDQAHITRLKALLSDRAAQAWLTPGLLEMALACVQIMVINFPSVAVNCTPHIRRFTINRLPAIEAETYVDFEGVDALVSATARCLAVCVQANPGDDAINSTMYTLMNASSHVTQADNDPSRRSVGVSFSLNQHGDAQHWTDRQSMLNDALDQAGSSVAANAVSMVAKLALRINKPEVIHGSTQMLLQRMRGADAATEAIILQNLVPLALASDDSDVLEVVRSFSVITRSNEPENPKHASSAVLAAQTTLARGLKGRRTVALNVLAEYLALFAERGSRIQNLHIPHGAREKERDVEKDRDAQLHSSNMLSQLAALLYPIEAILSLPDISLADVRSQDFVNLFRNMWLLCAMFSFTRTDSQFVDDAGRLALKRIARCTPPLLLESERDYVESGLEYNSILRRDYAAAILSKQRAILATCLSKQGTDIRSLSLPQVVFLQAVHDLELMRMQSGHPSKLLEYFSNESVNSSELLPLLDDISDKVTNAFLAQTSAQVLRHSISPTVTQEVRNMIVGATHRYAKVRQTALKMANTVISSFAALLCNRGIVFTLLETLTLMRRSCEDEYTDEYSTTYVYRSDKIDLELSLTDDFAVRNEITTKLYTAAKRWLGLALARAPIEMQSILQYYLRESRDVLLLDSVEMGAGLAMAFAKAISPLDRQESAMPDIAGWPSDSANLLASQFAAKQYFSGEVSGVRLALGRGLANLSEEAPPLSSPPELSAFRLQMAQALQAVQSKATAMRTSALRRLLLRAVAGLITSPKIDQDILHYLVHLPIRAFTPLAIAAGADAWSWLIAQRPEVEVSLITEISSAWVWTIKAQRGMFSSGMDFHSPLEQPIEYSPTNKQTMDHELKTAERMLKPHALLLQVIASRFQAVKYRAPGIMISIIRMLLKSFRAHESMSTHPLAREVRFSLVLFGFQVLSSSRLETSLEVRFRDLLYMTALSWFAARPLWSYGSNRIQLQAEVLLLREALQAVQNDHVRGEYSITSFADRPAAFPGKKYATIREYNMYHRERSSLLQALIENEVARLEVWSSPGSDIGKSSQAVLGNDAWPALVRRAWSIMPAVAVHMAERIKMPSIEPEVRRLICLQPRAVLKVPEALTLILGDRLDSQMQSHLQFVPLWAAVPPVTAVRYFQPRYGNNPLILQYAMHALEQYPVELTFFFVPQVVQALRDDGLGYVERFVFETSKISQLFCHQIIWNMKANCFKDDAGEVPDPMKPMLDRMVDMVVAALSGKARDFYDLEFGFFNEVTSISGKLKPFIKKSKPEKKAKIDEEMAKIKVSIGVYLPSNPDGVVVELDKKSGRPLQSHAKAPFMATFKVRKERIEFVDVTDSAGTPSEGAGGSDVVSRKVNYEVWQAAIFKVGDDCRQDVLALQLIAMFKNIFMSAGLVLYLFPYRVTATAPGCGVIDVVPNATSRDEMGRAKINDLFSYFVDKYGSVDSTAFQKARLNFIQSMAAYSVACYILQIKDRHNGNIMIDGDGHIVHIDFGFLFDIGPGGVKFEPNSFKLNHEMVVLMGGRESQGYRLFTELTIKAFLAIRPFADQLVDTVHLMLGTGLPSFKGEPTIQRLRNRFQLQLGERAAAEYMMGVIRNAHENYRSTVYDGFQKAQNGIPY